MSLAFEVRREQKSRLKALHTGLTSFLKSPKSEDRFSFHALESLIGFRGWIGTQIFRASWPDALKMTRVGVWLV
jgi:hypothetical protein